MATQPREVMRLRRIVMFRFHWGVEYPSSPDMPMPQHPAVPLLASMSLFSMLTRSNCSCPEMMPPLQLRFT